MISIMEHVSNIGGVFAGGGGGGGVSSLTLSVFLFNRKTFRMMYTENITNEDNNTIRVRSMNIIMLIFMSFHFYLFLRQFGEFAKLPNQALCCDKMWSLFVYVSVCYLNEL